MSDVLSPAAPAGDGVVSRLIGVVFSPRATFERIVARPRWFAALVIIVGLIALGQFALLSTESGQQAMIDQQVRRTEQWGGTVSDEQYATFERMAPYGRYFAVAGVALFVPIVTFAVSGALLGVFNALLGGNATYKQVLAVNTHSGATNLLGLLFTLPLNYLRESMSSPTNLGVFAQAFLDDTNAVARFLGTIDVFIVWAVFVNAIGLAVLYKRRTAPIFWSLMGVYIGIALIYVVVTGIMSGGA
jgi:Yip1-like protein